MFLLSKVPYLFRYGLYSLCILFVPIGQLDVLAQEAPPYRALLDQSITQAPLLLEQAANVRAANADAQQARYYLNPSINGFAENLGTAGSSGSNPRQTTFTMTQPFEIGGKRAARIEGRARDLIVAESRGRQLQVMYAAELATAYSTAEAMAARLDISTQDLSRANDDLRAAKALVAAGREAQLRVSQAQASVASAQAILESASANLIEALERLSVLAGSPSAFTSLSGNFSEQAINAARPEWNDAIDSPALLRAQAEREAFAAQVNIEEKRWIPNIGVSAGIRRFEGTNDNAFVMGLSSDIPVFDQNKGGIAAAKERVVAADARVEATRLESNANRRTALAQVNASERRLDAARQGEAAANEAYRLGKLGYESGKTSLIELLFIRRAFTDAMLTTIDARMSLVNALAALAIAEGRIAFGDVKP
jgi:cobalt-zinc-cadmium efflux system outer membrane protein